MLEWGLDKDDLGLDQWHKEGSTGANGIKEDHLSNFLQHGESNSI